MERRVSHGRERDENGKPRNWKEELFSINREISLVCHSITLPDTYPVTHMYSYTLEEYCTFLLRDGLKTWIGLASNQATNCRSWQFIIFKIMKNWKSDDFCTIFQLRTAAKLEEIRRFSFPFFFYKVSSTFVFPVASFVEIIRVRTFMEIYATSFFFFSLLSQKPEGIFICTPSRYSRYVSRGDGRVISSSLNLYSYDTRVCV